MVDKGGGVPPPCFEKIGETMKKKKVLLWGDGPMVTTGFGTVIRHIAKALHDTGRYDIDIVAINYWGSPYDHEEFPYRIWPAPIERRNNLQTGVGDVFGGVNFGMRYWTEEYDGVFILNDVNVLAERIQFLKAGPKGETKRPKAPVAYYFPIDSYWVHPEWLTGVALADVPVTYNEHGLKMLESVGMDLERRTQAIPHGTDVEAFAPIDMADERIAKMRSEVFDADDDTVVFAQVARNQLRKDNGSLLLAMRELRDRYPDFKCKLYLHMNPSDHGPGLLPAMASLGLKPGEDVVFPKSHNPGQSDFSVEDLNVLYNAADAFVTTTLGEGWGLPVTEAMGAGLPVLAPKNTSLTEILNVAGGEDELRGWPIPCGTNPQEWTQIDGTGYRPRVSIKTLVETMFDVGKRSLSERRKGEDGGTIVERTDRAREYVETISWDAVGKKWVELFDDMIAKQEAN